MKTTIPGRRAALKAGLALLASGALPPARACEFFAATLRVWHPWTYASRPDETTAILSMSLDEVTSPDRLVAVETPVAAGARLVRDGSIGEVDLLIPKGRDTVLGETGTHILLTGLRDPLQVGRTYPLKLRFEKGGIVDAQLNVDYIRTLLRDRPNPAA